MAVLGLFFFIWRELTYDNPIVRLKVLKNRNLRIGTMLSFIMGFGLYGSTFIIPLYTQQILGWDATQAGLLMVPAALTTAFLMPMMGKLMQSKIKFNYLIAVGMLIFFVFCFWGYRILTPDTGKGSFFWMLIMRGIAMAFLFLPITLMSLSTLKGREIGDGAAFTGMMRQLGGSFGIAIITTFMARQIVVHSANLAAKLDVTSQAVQSRIAMIKQGMMLRAGMTPERAEQATVKMIGYSVSKQAAVLSYMDVFLYIGLMFLICIPFVMMVKNRKKAEKIDMSAAH